MILFIAGPPGVGKSMLAAAWAERPKTCHKNRDLTFLQWTQNWNIAR